MISMVQQNTEDTNIQKSFNEKKVTLIFDLG